MKPAKYIIDLRKVGHLNIKAKMFDFEPANQKARFKVKHFSRPTGFLQKSSCRVSSEKNILNSSVESCGVE